MFVHVRDGQPAIADVENLRQLHVEFTGVDDEAGGAALAAAGLGTLDGDHVWLEIPALRAAGQDTDAWRSAFEGMITYAASRGWVAGTRVRAHVIRPAM